MEKLIIDRFEGNFAVCESENKTMIDIEINRLPKGSKEGAFIIMDRNGLIRLGDANELKTKKERISKMMDDLFE